MNEGIGAGHSRGAADLTAGDGVVTAEWRRIQRERLADERAEAGDETVDQAVASPSARRVPWRALGSALIAGVAVAVIANHYLAAVREPEPAESVGETARLGILSQPLPRPDPTEAAPPIPVAEQPTEAAGPEVFVPVPEAAVGPPARVGDPP